MTIFHYRGGTIDEVAPLAKTLKAYYLKHGVAYRLSRFQTGPNAGYAFKKLRTVLGFFLRSMTNLIISATKLMTTAAECSDRSVCVRCPKMLNSFV